MLHNLFCYRVTLSSDLGQATDDAGSVNVMKQSKLTPVLFCQLKTTALFDPGSEVAHWLVIWTFPLLLIGMTVRLRYSQPMGQNHV
jgi:hypothetical protein